MRRLSSALLLSGLALALAPAAAPAATRTINFDDFTAPPLFANAEPVTERYASLGVHFAGPAPGSGGAVLDVSALTVTGQSEPNALAFDDSASYAGGGTPTDPETITFDLPIHSASIRVGQMTGGTVTLRAFNGTTQVFSDTRISTQALETLDVAAPRITSLRLEYTGSATVWDDLTWGTAPVSRTDAFTTPANTTLNVGPAGVLGNDSDVDGDPLTATLARGPNNGLVELRPDGSFTYVPKSGFSGVDSFDYRANDGTGNGNAATVTVAVQPPPPPPPGLIPSTVTNNWLAFRTFTRNTTLTVNDVPAGARIRVTCKTKRKKLQRSRCPKARTINSSRARSKINIRKPFRKKKLPVGTRVRVTITASGFIGKRFTYTMRKRKVPRRQRQCIPPGGKPGKCT
jgi:hypothetical protein